MKKASMWTALISEWRDTHFRVEGPVVVQMQAVFMDNWIKAKGKVLHDATYSLLRAGIEIAEFAPTMFHVKAMVVDGLFVTVGSTNFDHRSFRLNDEANLNVFDAGFANEQIAVFDADWQRSRPISLAPWSNRPWGEKLLEPLASVLKSQL